MLKKGMAMKTLIACSMLILTATTGYADSQKTEVTLQSLSGVLKQNVKSEFEYYLQIDGMTGRMHLSGELLAKFKTDDHVLVTGVIKTRLCDPKPDGTPQAQPVHWVIFMEVHEIENIDSSNRVYKAAAPREEKSTEKPQRDMCGTLIPMGRLGHPIGTYLTIEGTRAEKGKVRANTLAIDKVNGKAIDQPIGVCIDNIDALPKGERCVFVGYESGKWIGTPPDVIKNTGCTVGQVPWQFYRFFLVISAEAPKELKEKFPAKLSTATE